MAAGGRKSNPAAGTGAGVTITVTESDAAETPRSNSPDSKIEGDNIERRMAAFKLQLKQAQKEGEELRKKRDVFQKAADIDEHLLKEAVKEVSVKDAESAQVTYCRRARHGDQSWLLFRKADEFYWINE